MERPKLGEDEEDLLKFQREFLASSSSPAATVVRKGDKRKSGETQRDMVQMDCDSLPAAASSVPEPPKKSRFKARRDNDTTSPDTSRGFHGAAVTPDMDPEQLMDCHDRGLATVLSSIIERDTRNSAFNMPSPSVQAFPSVVKNSSFKKLGGQQQKKSLFAQQVEKQGVQDFGVFVQQEASKMDTAENTSTSSTQRDPRTKFSLQKGDKPHIIDGRGLSASRAEEEAQSIHKENLSRLSLMSEEEILEEQQKLLQMLDPSLVSFLRSKSQATKAEPSQPSPKSPQKKNKEEPVKEQGILEDLPEDVPMKESNKWVHMDKVEYDKLQWMKDLPPPSADDAKTGQQARFDFNGNVIPPDADLPVNQALHHHGDEPQRAGYSIGELFQLARSTNVQQRVIALNTLASVIQKAKEGSLDDLIQTPLLPSIVEGGVIFLLRWALDDSVDAVVAAAVAALTALICNPADESALSMVGSWYQGLSVPCLTPQTSLQQMQADSTEQDEDNKAQETDAEVAKRDLIQGLVSRMMLVERLFYILDSRKPQAPTVISILHILTRVARHSSQLAYQLSRNTKLMNLIFSQFLPTTWRSQDTGKSVSNVYGHPLASAMRFVGCLCQAGRHVASSLMTSHPLCKTLLRYLAVIPRDLDLLPVEAEDLQKESYTTWSVLLTYGLAGDLYMDMYESLVEAAGQVVKRTSDLQTNHPTVIDVQLFSLLESVLPVAAIRHPQSVFNQGEGSVAQRDVHSWASWRCVAAMLNPVSVCVQRCLNHLAQHYTLQKGDLHFPAVCLNFLATYFNKRDSQPQLDAVGMMETAESLCKVLQPFFASRGFSSIVRQLSASSNLLSVGERRKDVFSGLPELGCDAAAHRLPVVSGSSPVGFLLALTRLTHTLCRLNTASAQLTGGALLNHEDTRDYLRQASCCPHNHLHCNHFTRFENLLLFYLTKLALLAQTASGDMRILHQVALGVLARLQEGDEFVAHDLMSTVIFQPDFIPDGKEEELATATMAQMKLSETHFLKSATQEEINTNNCHLLRKSYQKLGVIRGHYFQALAHRERAVEKSRWRYQQCAEKVSGLQTGPVDSYLMPQDWVFFPLVQLYNASATPNLAGLKGAAAGMVSSVLQWALVLELWRPTTLASISITLKISRLMCVFLADNDLFLERSVFSYLASLFRCYTTPRLLDKLDFNEQVPGISSFYDLYMLFLDQYEAVSFGDSLFGSFVLLPMQQNQNVLLRRAVWQERSHVLRTLTLPVSEMLLDIQRFLVPDETDPQLLQLYARCLLTGAVQQRWSPVLFVLALHHLNRFLFYTGDQTSTPLRTTLWGQVLKCNDEALKERIIYFKQVNTEVPNSVESYAELPPHRISLLDHYKNMFNTSQP